MLTRRILRLSSADQQRMHGYASKELIRLTRLVNDGPESSVDASTAKMVTALLSSEVNEEVGTDAGHAWSESHGVCEGVFSWRGFIYYKWTMSDFCPDLLKSLREIRELAPAGKMSFRPKDVFCRKQGDYHPREQIKHR